MNSREHQESGSVVNSFMSNNKAGLSIVDTILRLLSIFLLRRDVCLSYFEKKEVEELHYVSRANISILFALWVFPLETTALLAPLPHYIHPLLNYVCV